MGNTWSRDENEGKFRILFVDGISPFGNIIHIPENFEEKVTLVQFHDICFLNEEWWENI